MITIALQDASTLSIANCYVDRELIKALEGRVWDRKSKAWLLPVRMGQQLLRSCPDALVTAEARGAIEESRKRAFAFNLAAIRKMEHRSQTVNDWMDERGLL